ncbi:hypothetical protein UA74_02265 [Actinoalloteichus fjordicus]|uniref:Uncharacterized protein n=1 Tax=Actinoalloteichus fjordicus TaxID=1612552 RepID=A0AAC9L8Z1_9PSEU|nr:hypothetical protein UA74_02265 [Actinoalloteichus fjordicus]
MCSSESNGVSGVAATVETARGGTTRAVRSRPRSACLRDRRVPDGGDDVDRAGRAADCDATTRVGRRHRVTSSPDPANRPGPVNDGGFSGVAACRSDIRVWGPDSGGYGIHGFRPRRLRCRVLGGSGQSPPNGRRATLSGRRPRHGRPALWTAQSRSAIPAFGVARGRRGDLRRRRSPSLRPGSLLSPGSSATPIPAHDSSGTRDRLSDRAEHPGGIPAQGTRPRPWSTHCGPHATV